MRSAENFFTWNTDVLSNKRFLKEVFVRCYSARKSIGFVFALTVLLQIILMFVCEEEAE